MNSQAADISHRDEDPDEITIDETLFRLEQMIEESSSQDVEGVEFSSVLRSMIKCLDIDEEYVLIKTML